jgi:hypothetical protein
VSAEVTFRLGDKLIVGKNPVSRCCSFQVGRSFATLRRVLGTLARKPPFGGATFLRAAGQVRTRRKIVSMT